MKNELMSSEESGVDEEGQEITVVRPLQWRYKYCSSMFSKNILDRCRASGERSELDLSDRMAFWPAQLNAALRCMANSITVLWLS